MRYFLDTEFMEDGESLELLSIGIVCEDGRRYYAESSKPKRQTPNEWVAANVIPHLKGGEYLKPHDQIASEIRAFVGEDKPEFWGYYADYDWVVFCWLFGKMVDLPKGWPMYCRDLKQWSDAIWAEKMPKNPDCEHNALSDAEWNAELYGYLKNYRKKQPIARNKK